MEPGAPVVAARVRVPGAAGWLESRAAEAPPPRAGGRVPRLRLRPTGHARPLSRMRYNLHVVRPAVAGVTDLLVVLADFAAGTDTIRLYVEPAARRPAP